MSERDLLNLSNDAARLYEQDIVPTIMQPHTEAIFEHVALNEGERVLDIACGTGIVVRLAIAKFGNIASITGVDINAGMLAIARAHAPTTHIPIEWRESDVCELPFPEASFDVVLCQQGLQFVPDKLVALHEMRRVLVSGGRLALTIWSTPHRHAAAVADALRRHVNDEAAMNCLLPFAWNDAEAIRTLVDEAGFHDIAMEVIESKTRIACSSASVLDYMKSVASRSPFAREIEDCLTVLEQEVSAALQIYHEGDEFVMPSKAHLVQAWAP